MDIGCCGLGCATMVTADARRWAVRSIHPTLELLVESTTLAKLDPGELGALTMAVPTASLVFAEAFRCCSGNDHRGQ